MFGGLGLLAGIAALALSPPAARLAAAVTAGAGGAALLMTWLGRERTAAGEVLAGTALASWALPVALASGAPPSSGLGLWIVWSVTFAAATLAVRGVIARTRREAWKGSVAAASGTVLAGWLALGWMPLVQPSGLRSALLPAAILVAGLGVLPIGARHLHRVGWTIVVMSVTTMVLLLK